MIVDPANPPQVRTTTDTTENIDEANGGVAEEAASILKEDVSIDVDIKTDEQGRLTVKGNTNLPDGAELMVSLRGTSVDYGGDSKSRVSGGSFKSERFSSDDSGLPQGQYELSVSMSIPRLQSETVRKVIGEEGEHLKGPLVEGGVLGTSVHFEKPFSLKKEGAIVWAIDQGEVRRAADSKAAILREFTELEKQARAMAPFRDATALDKIRKCGELMRKNRTKAEELARKSESLPTGDSLTAKIIAKELALCATCSKDAEDYCDNAKTTLSELKQR